MSNVTIFRLNNVDFNAANLAEQIFDFSDGVTEVSVRSGLPYRLFIAQRDPKPPAWLAYVESISEKRLGFADSVQSAAVLVADGPEKANYVFALTWGFGFQLLDSDRIHPDLGLRTVLNLLADGAAKPSWDPERVRAVRSKRVSANTLIATMQLSRAGGIDAFPLQLDGDQLKQVTGTPTNSDGWGSTITGGTSLHVKRPMVKDIGDLCVNIATTYGGTAYDGPYGFIDNVRPIVDEEKLQRAIDEIYVRIAADDVAGITSAAPDLLDWTRNFRFELRHGRKRQLCVDPSVDAIRTFVASEQLGEFLEVAEQIRVAAIEDNGNDAHVWKLRDCLSAEVEIDGEKYQLDEGSLYLVNADYLRKLDHYVAAIDPVNLKLRPSRAGEAEAVYNGLLAASLGGILLDRQNVYRPGASAIEICDVATSSRFAIHAKRGTGSSTLSHLFAQGTVSANLLLMDSAFRDEARTVIQRQTAAASLANRNFQWLYDDAMTPRDVTIAFLILTEGSAASSAVELPFFSKVNLRSRCEELRLMGFNRAISLV